MWELDCEESWVPKNWCFWTVVWRRLLRILWTARRSNQSILKEISPGCSLEGLMLKLKLSPPDAMRWLVWKDFDAGKDWGQEEKGMTEDEMVGWHHQLLEFTQTHVRWVGYANQPSHPLSSPSHPGLNLSQHQGLFKWVSSTHQVAKGLEFQLQHQSFQWTLRADLL